MEKVIEHLMAIFNEDKKIMKEFFADPKGILEKHGIEFDTERLKDIVETVKAKVNLEKFEEKGEEILDDVTGFFKK